MTDEVVTRLREIRDGQQLQLERQTQALMMQREQFEIAMRQFERAEGQLQARSARVIGFARKLMLLIVPLIVLLIALLPWMVFR
jgi:hypothetical protein